MGANVACCLAALLSATGGAKSVELPHTIEAAFRVEPGQTAYLRHDVLVKGVLEFGAGSRLVLRGREPARIVVTGKLTASGDKDHLVWFGAGKVRRNQWKGILADGQVELAWAVIQGAEAGITARHGSALDLDSVVIRYCGQGINGHSNMRLKNCLVAKNFGDGVYFASDGVAMASTSILSNEGWGIRTGHYPKLTLTDCSIIGNAQGGLWLGSREGKDPSCEATRCNIHSNGQIDIRNGDRSREVILDGCYLGSVTTREIKRKGEKANLTRIIDLFDGTSAPVSLRNPASKAIAEAGCSLDCSWVRRK